jgi:hypothetical protein
MEDAEDSKTDDENGEDPDKQEQIDEAQSDFLSRSNQSDHENDSEMD